jgi:curved DNA-binding protein CbpA/GGDEF domain-containing protein
MIGYFDCYKTLGVSVGAEISDVTSSYKKLCRQYHPDINDDPESEELMKGINLAYSVLREKYRREAAFRERMPFSSYVGKFNAADIRYNNTTKSYNTRANEAAEAFTALFGYFRAIKEYEYSRAYDWLSDYDKRDISREMFTQWRKAVARMHPLLDFKVVSGSEPTKVSLDDRHVIVGRKYSVKVTEEDVAGGKTDSEHLEKVVICENGAWRVLLGYRNVDKLINIFNSRFEVKKTHKLRKQWEEYYAQQNVEYDLLNHVGMRKAVKRELYRHERYGSNLTFAAVSLKVNPTYKDSEELLLQSAARSLVTSLRETDIPAYVGNGVFAILFVELERDDAEEILNRLIAKMQKSGGARLGEKVEIEFSCGSWNRENIADFESINEIFRKFNKTL